MVVKQIKKVGIPTNIIRKGVKNTEGLKVINGSFNGVSVELTQDSNKPFYYGCVELKGVVNVQFQNDLFITNERATNTLWLNNKSLYQKIKKGLITEFELNDLIINLNGEYVSKYAYAFYSNENDFTLED